MDTTQKDREDLQAAKKVAETDLRHTREEIEAHELVSSSRERHGWVNSLTSSGLIICTGGFILTVVEWRLNTCIPCNGTHLSYIAV